MESEIITKGKHSGLLSKCDYKVVKHMCDVNYLHLGIIALYHTPRYYVYVNEQSRLHRLFGLVKWRYRYSTELYPHFLGENVAIDNIGRVSYINGK